MKFWIWVGCLGVTAIMLATFQVMLDTTISPLFQAIIMGIACATAVSLCKGYNEKNDASKKTTHDNFSKTDSKNEDDNHIE
ncbi:MAG: hypothetical protein IJ393_07150 [Clostridia bacterium]|nr:hypothetical protein [Clostridia bacterium]